MQGYMYSVFSSVALVIHLIINFDLLIGRRAVPAHGARYRGMKRSDGGGERNTAASVKEFFRRLFLRDDPAQGSSRAEDGISGRK